MQPAKGIRGGSKTWRRPTGQTPAFAQAPGSAGAASAAPSRAPATSGAKAAPHPRTAPRSGSNKWVRSEQPAAGGAPPPAPAQRRAAASKPPPRPAPQPLPGAYVKQQAHQLVRAVARPAGSAAPVPKPPARPAPKPPSRAAAPVPVHKHSAAPATSGPPTKHKVWRREDGGKVALSADTAAAGAPRASGSRPSGPPAGEPTSACAAGLVPSYKLSQSGFKLIRSGLTSGIQAAQLSPAYSARRRVLRWQGQLATRRPLHASSGGWRGRKAGAQRRAKAGHAKDRGNAQPRPASKPSKLKRIGEHVYRVEGTGAGQTLTRQTSDTLSQVAAATAARRVATAASAAVTARLRAQQQAASTGVPTAVKGSSRAAALLASAKRQSRMRASQSLGKQAGLLAVRRRVFKRLNVSQRRPCPVFCRTGRCKEKNAGLCAMTHDPDKVAVCPRWLLGKCTDANCTRQHQARTELMPICAYFLQGKCSHTECPYLHVKVDPGAPVCQAFMRGYCPKGRDCPMKHLSKAQLKELRASARSANGADGAAASPLTQRTKFKLVRCPAATTSTPAKAGGEPAPGAKRKRQEGPESASPRKDPRPEAEGGGGMTAVKPAFLRVVQAGFMRPPVSRPGGGPPMHGTDFWGAETGRVEPGGGHLSGAPPATHPHDNAPPSDDTARD